jgi:Protein of unknown function (DUF3106)
MSSRLQFVRWMLGVTLCGVVSLPCVAQKNHPAPPPRPPRQQVRQQKQQKQKQNQNQNQGKENPNRPPVNQTRPALQPPPATRANSGNEAGARNGLGRNSALRPQGNGGGQGQWVQRMRSLTPAQRERFFQSSPAFRNLPPERQNRIRQQFNQWDRMTPQQRADQVDRENTWRHLTPEQREHIKNDVYPRYQQLPPERQQAIERRLRILQNMPESARNERLSDPKFTDGMNDEDKAMLHDLSHMHVGGPPDPPSE